jgi:hypothetical protein
MKQFFILILVSICLHANAQLLPKYGDSRSGTTGFQFLKIAPDARSVGMGEAFTAVVNDVSAVYWNPAGLTKLDSSHYHFQISNTAYFSNVKLQQVVFAKKLKHSTFVAAHLTYLNSGYMNVATEFAPQGNGQQFNYNNIDAGLSLAKALTDNFSFGFTFKYIQEGIATVKTKNVVADFGFQYDIGKGNTRFAVGISNFGSPTNAGGSIIKSTFSGDKTITEFEKINVPAIFRLGVATDVYKKNNQMLTVAAQLNHPTDNNESVNIGAEYNWHKTFYGRMGYQFGADEVGIPNFGFGLLVKRKFGSIRVDYGFQNKKILGTVHRISLTADIF